MARKTKIKSIDNLELHNDEGYVIVSVNPKIFSIDTVYSAAYAFIDRAFVFLDGNPKKNISARLRPKNKGNNLERIGRDFNDELLNYSVYKIQSEKNRLIKEAIVQRALITNLREPADTEDKEDTAEESYIDDPLGIAKPWGEAEEDKRVRKGK